MKKLFFIILAVLFCASTFAKVWTQTGSFLTFNFYKDTSKARSGWGSFGLIMTSGAAGAGAGMTGQPTPRIKTNDGLISQWMQSSAAKDDRFIRNFDIETSRRNFKGSLKMTFEEVDEMLGSLLSTEKEQKSLKKNIKKCDYMYVVLDDGLIVVENNENQYYTAAFYED